MIELIRRPAQGSNENAGTPSQRNVYTQRFFALASVRILLSDTAAEITSLPTVTATAPVALSAAGSFTNYAPVTSLLPRSPIGSSDAPGAIAGPAGGQLPGYIYKGNHEEPVLGGFIKIEIQRQPGAGLGPTEGVWQDVTGEVLGLGISGRNIADANEALATRWNNTPEGAADTCAEPHPNAIIRLQRVRDIPISLAPCGIDTDVAGDITGNILAVSQNEHDYWPNALYDTREAQTRDGLADTTDLTLSGVMQYVELDVNNLRRWLAGQFAAAPFGAPNGPNAKNDNGYIIYFSDRRNNKNAAGRRDRRIRLGRRDQSDRCRRCSQRTDGRCRVRGARSGRASLLPRGLQRQPPPGPVRPDACPPQQSIPLSGRMACDAHGALPRGWPNPLRSTALVTDR